ncbi:hypothetical protein ACFL13_01855 [Patescibacteria group bacterium]
MIKDMEDKAPAQDPKTASPPADNENSAEKLSREEVVGKKKKRFKKWATVFGIVVGSLLIFLLVTYISYKIAEIRRDRFKTGPQDPIIIEEGELQKDKIKNFSTGEYRFSIDYPEDDFLVDRTEDEGINPYVQINYKNTIPLESVGESTFDSGYAVRVTRLYLETITLDETVQIKRRSFGLKCPPQAVILDTADVLVSELGGLGFEIKDCEVNYMIRYVLADDYVYELMGFYEGDLGYEQVYRRRIEEIFDTFKIFLLPKVLSPTIEVKRSREEFSFEYPRELDTECCEVVSPPSGGGLLMMGAEKDNTNAIGIFLERNTDRIEFREYVEKQRIMLIDEHRVARGSEPQGQWIDLPIEGSTAVLLRDYSWRGNDLIYIDIPNEDPTIAISKTNISDEIFNQILSSFKFNLE